MFHKLTIKKIIRETVNAVSIILEPEIEESDLFQFKSGQYLTFRFTLNGKEERRSYSICSAPHEKLLKVMVKEVPEGLVSLHLNRNIEVGQSLESMVPSGKFIAQISPDHAKKHLAFAAGSGITPVISIIKEILFSEPASSCKLYYGNKNVDSIIFREELTELQLNYSDRFKVHHFLSREQIDDFNFYGGRLTPDQIEKIINQEVADEYYLCGPEPMINAARETLSSKNIPEDSIHFELFTTTEIERTTVTKPNIVGAQVKVMLDGIETEFQMSPNDSVLSAAIDEGLDVPYACQGGTCCTCQAKLLEGDVTMDVNMVLTDQELEQGYILTCQSHPITDKISVDYDNV